LPQKSRFPPYTYCFQPQAVWALTPIISFAKFKEASQSEISTNRFCMPEFIF
jgi:hypothetical protein